MDNQSFDTQQGQRFLSVCYPVSNVECVYSSDTTILIGIIERYNYMFRCLVMAIFRLYMKYLLSSYTKHTWAVYMG